MKLSIIIPVYNEKRFILQVLNKIEKINLGTISKEIIIIDDCSTDSTKELLQKIKRNYKIFFNEKNMGKGYSIRQGLKYATGDYIIFQDADLEYDPIDYKKLVEAAIKNKGAVIYGNRFHKSHEARYKSLYLGNILLSFSTSILYNKKINDMETCYKLFPKKTIKSLDLKSNGFDIEPEITAKLLKKGIKIIEVPIKYRCRTYEEGKKISWKDGFKALFVLLKNRF